MSAVSGPIYEVTLSIERDTVAEFDTWLAAHVEAMLEVPGFVTAEIFEMDDDDQGRPRRIVHYLLESDADLERYLAGPAAEMRQPAIDRFGDRFEADRRVLRQTEFDHGELRHAEHCLNCGSTLSGQYCGNCGQRARSRLISIWELTRDAFGDLFEIDSRLWRTLIPLIAKPGKLTRDYLEGRRARFMPPFRTYLVLSIVFFLVAFFNPREEFGILFEPGPPASEEPAAAEETPVDGEPASDSPDLAEIQEEIRNEILAELEKEGLVVGEDEIATMIAERLEVAEDGGVSLSLSTGTASGECDFSDGHGDHEDMPEWLQTRLTPERLEVVCERVLADDGRVFFEKLLDNVPAGLFILLPLMALVLKMLYPLSKRYYVEHLLFVLHYHAFFFLILTIQITVARIGGWTGLPESMIGVALVAMAFYIPVYLYMAMRRVYDQGHLATIPKYFMLMMAYFIGMTMIFAAAVILAAFAI